MTKRRPTVAHWVTKLAAAGDFNPTRFIAGFQRICTATAGLIAQHWTRQRLHLFNPTSRSSGRSPGIFLATAFLIRAMTEESTQGEKTWGQQLSARASRLTEKGAHHFVDWLIRAGVGNPEMLAEYERALNKVERDPSLK